MRSNASRWAQVSSQMQSVAGQSRTGADFGLVKSVEPAYNLLAGVTNQWSTQAGSEFDAMNSRLGTVAGDYESTEATNAAIAGGIND